MATALNRNRVRNTAVGLVICLLLAVFSRPFFAPETAMSVTMHSLGNVLVIVCIVGRLWSTAFLGGHKNATLITYGAFSICRNPLYFFSFLGACGIGILSLHLVLAVAIPVLYCVVFFGVIRREEGYLTEHFGEPYAHYCKKTPRFFPNLARYHAPETVPMVPKYMVKALRDALSWLAVFPVFELIAYLQTTGVIVPPFTLF